MFMEPLSANKISQSAIIETLYPQNSSILKTLKSKSCLKSFSNSESKS